MEPWSGGQEAAWGIQGRENHRRALGVLLSVEFSFQSYFLDEKAISLGLLLSLDMFYPIAQKEIYNNGETCPFSENTSIE